MYKNIYILYIYILGYTCVCFKVCTGKAETYVYICGFAQLEFIYKSIYHMLYVYLWMNVYIQRGSKCGGSRGQRHM